MARAVRVILARPEQPRNIGAALRAAANFGAEGLWISAPADWPWGDEEKRLARVASAGAWEVMGEPKRAASLVEAAAGCARLIGTSGRHRRSPGARAMSLVEAFSQENWRGGGVDVDDGDGRTPWAVAFGSESSGLSSEELDLCDSWLMVPTSEKFSSMNLGHAVAVVLYEAGRGMKSPARASAADAAGDARRADASSIYEMALRWRALIADAENRAPADLAREREILARAIRLVRRGQPSREDVAALESLRGLLEKRWRRRA